MPAITDSLPVLGGMPAVTVGAALLVAVGLLVAGGLLLRDGTTPILLGFTILALAFFVLPTRVHERYLFPFFATGAILAAPGLLRMAGLAVVAALNTINLHAVLAGDLFIGPGRGGFGGGPGGLGGRGGFGGGGFGSIGLPWGDLARSETAVTLVALGGALALIVLLTTWAIVIVRPTAGLVSRPLPAPSSP